MKWVLINKSDEIVDTFHELDKEKVLNKFEEDTFESIKNNFSTNPVLHSFQIVVNKKYMNNKELELLDSEPQTIEPWDPLGTLA